MRTLREQLGEEWFQILDPLFDTATIKKLTTRLAAEKNVEPSPGTWFKAYEYVQPSQLKVLIIGQDPYPGGQANGLAFSSVLGMPPSLKVIFNELRLEYGVTRLQTDLTDWAKQGVMLLNTVLTTRYKQTLAHAGWGWEMFIRETLRHIAKLEQPYVVLAWGAKAQNIARDFLMDAEVLAACHPQAENYPGPHKFTGCNHFRQTNEFLIKNNLKPIKWV